MSVSKCFVPGAVLGIVAAGQLATSALAADLSVKISNIANGNGNILVGVCVKETFLTERCTPRSTIQAQPGSVTVVFRDLTPGTYAVQATHDEKRLGRPERDALGVPTSGYGTSNDAPAIYGPPAFADSSFELKSEGLAIELLLHYVN